MEHAEINSAYKMMVTEIFMNSRLQYLVEEIAESDEFRRYKTIVAYPLGTNELAPLVNEYGYDMVNEFVLMLAQAKEQRYAADSSAG